MQEAVADRERFVQDFFPELRDQIEPLKKQPPSAARDEKIDALMDSVPAPINYDYDPAKSEEFDSKHAAFNPDVLKAIWPAGVSTLDFRKSLATVKCPILVLAGRVDHIVPPRLTRQFRVYAPRAEFVMFEKSGHDTFLEEPAKLIQVLVPFLAKQ
jgi:proline iminopeptidase